MTGLVALGVLCAIVTTAMVAALWHFAGFQYVLLISVAIFISWLLQEFWPLIKYLIRNQK